ncbi:hypothetical protein KW782_03260 [Candidatus Parcubacteria bacterium]|nr:hypothetical protein [Candidatus Parcubacteria bacterium]
MDNQPQQSNGAHQNDTLMGVLAYLGPLVIIPFLVSKEVPFVKFHIKQGLVLLVIELILMVASMTLGSLWVLFQIVNLIVLVLSIIGIINVVQKQEKILPGIGQFAAKFKI